MLQIQDVSRQYPAAALPRAHSPDYVKTYALYRDCLRLDFSHTCVYCLSTEFEVAPGESCGNFEIEHFRPQGEKRFKQLASKYRNLYWSCHACNRAKGNRWPTDRDVRLGRSYVDPCDEALADHLDLNGLEVSTVNGSPRGDYMIDEINLNSAVHRKRRERRAEAAKRISLLQAIIDSVNSSQLGKGLDATVQQKFREAEKELIALASALERSAADPPVSRCRCT